MVAGRWRRLNGCSTLRGLCERRPPRPQSRRRAVHPEASYDTAELIRRAREGNLDAFDELIVRHESRVLRLAYHMVGNADEAADVAQEVFVRIFKYINKIRDETKFATWSRSTPKPTASCRCTRRWPTSRSP